DYGLSPDKVEAQVAQINSTRRDHYAYYTGKIWGDPRNYHAVYDTSRLPAQAIVESIIALAADRV
ncbi:MAG: cytidylate kinase-like family protein, partial [Duncaniella sp.]|nr:cytidylate kinase-like family protein [Duncaniella sp.]